MSATAVAHVPKGQHTQPLVTLFDQHGADQPGDSGLVPEDANDIGAPSVLFVQALQRIGRAQFGAVLNGQGHVGQHAVLAVERF
jgi:hypothetical protein